MKKKENLNLDNKNPDSTTNRCENHDEVEPNDLEEKIFCLEWDLNHKFDENKKNIDKIQIDLKEIKIKLNNLEESIISKTDFISKEKNKCNPTRDNIDEKNDNKDNNKNIMFKEKKTRNEDTTEVDSNTNKERKNINCKATNNIGNNNNFEKITKGKKPSIIQRNKKFKLTHRTIKYKTLPKIIIGKNKDESFLLLSLYKRIKRTHLSRKCQSSKNIYILKKIIKLKKEETIIFIRLIKYLPPHIKKGNLNINYNNKKTNMVQFIYNFFSKKMRINYNNNSVENIYNHIIRNILIKPKIAQGVYDIITIIRYLNSYCDFGCNLNMLKKLTTLRLIPHRGNVV